MAAGVSGARGDTLSGIDARFAETDVFGGSGRFEALFQKVGMQRGSSVSDIKIFGTA
jgi:hypothetical protein